MDVIPPQIFKILPATTATYFAFDGNDVPKQLQDMYGAKLNVIVGKAPSWPCNGDNLVLFISHSKMDAGALLNQLSYTMTARLERDDAVPSVTLVMLCALAYGNSDTAVLLRHFGQRTTDGSDAWAQSGWCCCTGDQHCPGWLAYTLVAPGAGVGEQARKRFRPASEANEAE